jgi:hypothetical protein
MDEYIIIMRLDLITKGAQPSPEQMQIYMKMYHDWVEEIAARNQFVGGKGLSTEGRVVKPGNAVTDGPYAELKEAVAGFIIVKAKNFDDALEMAQRCPILQGENTVEVRKIVSVHN